MSPTMPARVRWWADCPPYARYAPTFEDEANPIRREIMALTREEEERREWAAREAMNDPGARRIRLRALKEMRDERLKRNKRDLG